MNFDNLDGRVFYEDSISTLHDVYLLGSHANVMGTIEWFVMGTNTFYRNFSGIVTKNDVKRNGSDLSV